MAKCKGCGRDMNPVETMVAGKHGKCGACVRKEHRKVVKGR